MHYKLAVLISMGLSATQTIAYSHGEQGEFNGKAIKWQQLAEGVFTGVPAEEWDNKGICTFPTASQSLLMRTPL